MVNAQHIVHDQNLTIAITSSAYANSGYREAF